MIKGHNGLGSKQVFPQETTEHMAMRTHAIRKRRLVRIKKEDDAIPDEGLICQRVILFCLHQ